MFKFQSKHRNKVLNLLLRQLRSLIVIMLLFRFISMIKFSHVRSWNFPLEGNIFPHEISDAIIANVLQKCLSYHPQIGWKGCLRKREFISWLNEQKGIHGTKRVRRDECSRNMRANAGSQGLLMRKSWCSIHCPW